MTEKNLSNLQQNTAVLDPPLFPVQCQREMSPHLPGICFTFQIQPAGEAENFFAQRLFIYDRDLRIKSVICFFCVSADIVQLSFFIQRF